MKFKTNARCQGCVAAITKALAPVAVPENITFDLNSPDKTLEIRGVQVPAEEIVRLVGAAGFKAEVIE